MYGGIGTLVQVEGSIDVPMYTKILNVNLKPFVVKHFMEKPTISRMTVHQHTIPNLHEWKVTKKIPGMTWPAQSSDMNIKEYL